MSTSTTGPQTPETPFAPPTTLLPAPSIEPAAPQPTQARSYVHQMRGPSHRWWRPLLALLVAGVRVVA